MKYNVILIALLNVIKSSWFLLTLHIYNYINTLQVRLRNRELDNVVAVDTLLNEMIDRYNAKKPLEEQKK